METEETAMDIEKAIGISRVLRKHNLGAVVNNSVLLTKEAVKAALEQWS